MENKSSLILKTFNLKLWQPVAVTLHRNTKKHNSDYQYESLQWSVWQNLSDFLVSIKQHSHTEFITLDWVINYQLKHQSWHTSNSWKCPLRASAPDERLWLTSGQCGAMRSKHLIPIALSPIIFHCFRFDCSFFWSRRLIASSSSAMA